MVNSASFSEIAAEVSTERDKIYWEHLLDPNALAAAVQRAGIAVFPGLLSPGDLEQLNAEFEQLVYAHKAGEGPFLVDAYDQLINIRVVRKQLGSSDLLATAGLFGQPFMADVSRAFFGDDQFRLNGEIFVTELGEGPEVLDTPPFALHFDKRQVLKFYFYLTDTTEANGAMRASPGSNKIIRDMRLSASRAGDLNSIVNILPDEEVPSFPITGPAGTMLVFDTDMAHGASRVSPGNVRRTMRGHTHSHEMLRAMGLSPPYH